MRAYICSGSTPAVSRSAATAKQRGDVLPKRKPPVSVTSAVYSDLAIGVVIVSPRSRAKSYTNSAVAQAAVSLTMGWPLSLGLDAKSMVLLVLTLIVATLSLGAGRTTVLQGAVHLVIFAVYLFTTVAPIDAA